MARLIPQNPHAMSARFGFGLVYRLVYVGVLACVWESAEGADPLRDLQDQAIASGKSPVAHWGIDRGTYAEWSNHTNRLVPVYTFGGKGVPGIDLSEYSGENSPYRKPAALRRLYGRVPPRTVSTRADYLDQTSIYEIQKAALLAKKKNIFVVIFDGMSWHASRAAAVYQSGKVYSEGRGSGLFFQDYAANDTTQFGYMVTSPYCDKLRANVNEQTVGRAEPAGGYDPGIAGFYPWSTPTEPLYLRGANPAVPHVFTDSASSATSMSAGVKTFNAAIGVSFDGQKLTTTAMLAQSAGYAIGTVTSVPFCHATPGAFYAHNVGRSDYQDIARDMLGLPSVSHRNDPLPGLDVVLGAGWGIEKPADPDQGDNFVPGNRYLAEADRKAIDVKNGGKYVVSVRSAGKVGADQLRADAAIAKAGGHRLFGFYGCRSDHLPYRTADGDYRPAKDKNGQAEGYTSADVSENPNLADMTDVALNTLAGRGNGIWLMVEAGDVDFAKHNNNLDNMIGAIISGDAAVQTIARWVEKNSNWQDSIMLVTADHGHYLVIDDLEAIASASPNRR